MTGVLTWTSMLLLAGPVVLLLLALRHRQSRHPASFRMLLLLYAIGAAAPLIFALVWRLDATRAAIELHGIAFRAEGTETLRKEVRERRAGSGRIVIGDPESRRTRAQRTFATLVFVPATTAGAKGALRVELPPRGQRAGLVAAGAHGLLGAEPLEDGDRICIAGSCWTHGDRSFAQGKHVATIPRRQAEIPGLGWSFPLPFARPVTAASRTWSLDVLARQSGAIAPERRLRSFVAYANPGARLSLVALDDDVQLVRDGTRVRTPDTFDIEEDARLSFHTLPNESAEFAAGGISERRSMVYRAGERSFALHLDTPEVHTLTMRELRALELAQEKGARRKTVALAMGDAQLVDRSLYFAGLSESVAVEANALLELSRFFPRDFASTFRVISPRGPVDAQLGSVQWIGASDLAAIRVDVLRPPLLLLVIGALLLLFKAGAASAAQLTMAQALMAAAIELLCGLRLLMGYRVWSMPPHRVEAAELATVAWMAIPWIFIAACLPLRSRERWREGLPAWAGLALSAVVAAKMVEGPTKWVWVLCHALPLLPLLSPYVARASARAKQIRDPILAAAIAFTVVRVILLAFGWKESANLGVRVSLSVIHIPAAAVLQGFYFWRVWQRVQQHGTLERRDLRDALAILLFVWGIPAALTSDIGLALLNAPLFVLMLLAVTRHSESRQGKLLARVLVGCVVVFVAGAPLIRLLLPLVPSEQLLLSAASDTNYARFLHFAAPERLQELATKRGESLAITSAILQSYISTGLFGRGYGHTEVSPHLGDTALRDFAPAVFVAAEWGLVGTVAALLIYLLFAVIASAWLPWSATRDADAHPGPAIAFIAAATIAVSSIYMILANHELLLLTGKNAYLLGLDSAGDVIEVIALVLLIAWGSSRLRDDDAGISYGGLA